MITSAGPICDVCGSFILPGCSESVNPFCIKGIKETLFCHDKCRPFVEAMSDSKDWTVLPAGPLRNLYAEEHAARSKDGAA